MKSENTSIRLKKIMADRNIKQVDILEKCKPFCERYDVTINKSDISQYVSGKTEPGSKKLSILGMALDVNETWLMGYDVPMERKNATSLSIKGDDLDITEEGKKKLGNLLTKKRKERDLDIPMLSKRSGISEEELKKIEEGSAVSISFQTIIALADSLDTTISYFSGDTWNYVTMDLTEGEAYVIHAYREQEEKRHAVNQYLGIWDNPHPEEMDASKELEKNALWSKYCLLDGDGKEMVDFVLEKEYDRASRNNTKDYLMPIAAHNDNANNDEQQQLMQKDIDEL